MLRNNIIQLIHDAAIPDQRLFSMPSSYAALRQTCLIREHITETNKLRDLFSNSALTDDALKQAFILLCRERQQRNQSSCLSYFAMPESHCNQLYWRIATVLFQPRNLEEMIHVLLPNITNVLVMEEFVAPKQTAFGTTLSDRLTLSFRPAPTTELLSQYPSDLAILRQFVVDRDTMLSVREFAHMPLFMHIKIYQALSVYPGVREKLYSHNTDWQQVKQAIDSDATPKEVLERFAFDLERSGSRYSGKDHAMDAALSACARFRGFLDNLSESHQLTILNLCSSNAKTLQSVMDDLSDGRCVEEASKSCYSILSVPSNQTILSRLIVNRKQPSVMLQNGLQLDGYDQTTDLPSALKQEAMADIIITSVSDCVDLLLNLPTSEYSYILRHAEVAFPILHSELVNLFDGLSNIQRTSFVNAVLENINKLGGRKAFLNFAISTDIQIFNRALSLYPEQNRVFYIELDRFEITYNESILHYAAHFCQVDIFNAILALYPDTNKLSVLNKKTRITHHTVLHAATLEGNSDVFKAILSLYPMEDRFSAIMNRDNMGNSVLRDAAKNCTVEVVNIILSLYPPEQRLSAVMERNFFNNSVLACAATNANPDVFRTILDLYPKEAQLSALLNQGFINTNCLHAAVYTGNIEVIKVILSAYPEATRLKLMKAANTLTSSVLHFAAAMGNSAVMMLLLSYLSEENRIEMMRDKDPLDDTVWDNLEGNTMDMLQLVNNIIHASFQIVVFKQLYQAILKIGNVSPCHFLSSIEALPTQGKINAIQAFCENAKTRSETVVVEAWQLTTRFANDFMANPSEICEQALNAYKEAHPNSNQRKRSNSSALFFPAKDRKTSHGGRPLSNIHP